MKKALKVSLFVLFFLTAVCAQSQVILNELQSSNSTTIVDFENDYPDWIELQNIGAVAVDLKNYSLSDNSGNPFKWIIPSISIEPGAYLLVFASGKDTIVNNELHTNFKLSSSGEEVFLVSPNGVLLDEFSPDELLPDQSWGRTGAGLSSFTVFSNPTPNEANVSGEIINNLKKSDVSLKPGFYENEISLDLTCPDSGASVIYSLDGNPPSMAYTSSLSISNTTVVKSQCIKDGAQSSDTKTDSYFIGSNHDIPVISLSFKPDDFYSRDSGIYVFGPSDYDFSLPYRGANFWEDWEREVHLEYFVEQDEKIEQDMGIKIFGGWSRAHQMRGLRLIARKELGNETIDYPFFKSKPYLDKFDQLILRNGGNDFNGSMWSDIANHEAIKQVSSLDLQAAQPVVVYFNGEYKGIHNLRERTNPEYLASNHDIDDKQIDLLELNGGIDLPTADDSFTPEQLASQIKQGSNESFVAMYDFIKASDMSLELNYNQVKETFLDVDLFIDYFSAQIYHINNDWPHNNIRMWRSTETDGKWKYIYYDTEFGKGIYGRSVTSASFNELRRVINDERNVHSIMFKKLLGNVTFRDKFINRSADLMNTIYLPENFAEIANKLENAISSEMPKHLSVNDQFPGSCCRDGSLDDIFDFIDSRPNNAKNHIASQLGVAKHELTLNVEPAGSGVIKINTIIPDVYPFTGTYFNGVPVGVTAIPNDGYKFEGWSNSGATTAEQLLTLSGTSSSVLASFTETSETVELKITEVNYHSFASLTESGDWFELYNNGSGILDLSNWVFKDELPNHQFVFPENTILGAGEYLVVAQDVNTFSAVNPGVTNLVNQGFGFSLGNGGDELLILDSYGIPRTSFIYDDNAPWPELADGKGATLELLSVNLDNTLPVNWTGACKGGSPGESYEECECDFSVELGEDAILCSEIPEVLSTGLSSNNKEFLWYKDGDLISVSEELSVTEPNEYKLLVNSGRCLAEDDVNLVDGFEVDLGPQIRLCSPSVDTIFPTTINSTLSYLWKREGEVVGDSSLLKVKNAGQYTVIVSKEGCETIEDSVLVISDGPEVFDAEFCDTSSSNVLDIIGDGDYEWFNKETGGLSLEVGNTLIIEKIESDTIFYVQNNSLEEAVGGLMTPGNSEVEASDQSMLFTVNKEGVSLDAVTVNYGGFSSEVNLVLRVLNDNGDVLKQVSQVLSEQGEVRIEISLELPQGDYSMDLVGTSGNTPLNLFSFDSLATGYPYLVGDLISITGSSSGNSASNYFFFYDWEASKGKLACARIPVEAKVQKCIISNTTNLTSYSSFDVYPNPTSDRIFFTGDVTKVRLLSLSGVELEIQVNDLELGLATRHISPGVYLLEMTDGEKLEVKKVQID